MKQKTVVYIKPDGSLGTRKKKKRKVKKLKGKK